MHISLRISIAASACSAFLFLVGCEKHAPAAANQPLPVTTVQVTPRSLPLILESVGRTEGSKEVELRARVSGILDKQSYTEGTVVKPGAVMFRIDPAPFNIALEHARAALSEAQAHHQQAQRNADRLKELLIKNLVSRSDADNAISALEAADAAEQAAKANVREAELNLSYTKVTAPIGGIAGRALRSEGSLVTAGSDSSLLTTVTQADPIWARFALSASEYETVRKALNDKRESVSVQLLHKDGSVYPQTGKLNFAGSTVDTNLGTVQLRAEFPNANLSLLPGEYLRVRLSAGAQSAITVPQTAVLQGAKGAFVWVVNGENQAEQRIVKTASWVGNDWRIDDGLNAGDTVIVDNLLKLKPGMAVKVSQASQPAVATSNVGSATSTAASK